jgi:hypothetical protein
MERTMKYRWDRRRLTGVLASIAVLAAAAGPGVAATESVRTVRGEVVAVNGQATPPTIVVKAMIGKKELIVGVTVEQQVPVTRGGKPVALGDIKAGEVVELRYVKHEDGLAARAIRAR